MMEHSIYSRHKRLLSAMLIGAAGLYGLTNPTSAHALIEQPIYEDPATSPNYCMADAYFDQGGAGMKGDLGEALNCTANDVEITEVIPLAVILSDGSESDKLTCTSGQPFKLKADVRVRVNAAERWDTTFYVPRKEGVNPDEISQDSTACSILLPVPIGTSGYDASYLVAQQLDGDVCGDIRKADLTNDEYTLHEAVFNMICEDRDPDGEGPLKPDGQADFSYCAAWDNQERLNCESDDAYPGQAPNTKSKCKCDTFDIPVFLEPNPPKVVKTVQPSSGNERQATFKYTLTITKADGADVKITELYDIYRSSTDSAIYEIFDLSGGADNQGILNLLESPTNPNTCNDAGFLPKTLTATAPSASCSFYVQITDDNLPDELDGLLNTPDLTVNAPGQPEELYENFIRFSATDTENRNTVIGNNTCDPTDNDDTNNDGNCSNVVPVKMVNVDPAVTISKTPDSGPGLRDVEGTWFVDDQGYITYEITVTNNSTVDPVWIAELVDDNGTPLDPIDDINLLTDSSGSPSWACSDAPQSSPDTPLAKAGGTFTCRYVVDVVVDEGSTYTNTVNVVVYDNEARIAKSMDDVSVTRAEPMVLLEKEVAVSLDATATPPTPLLDSAAFMDSIDVDEPGDEVVYRFTITNANAVSEEDITVIELIDDTLFDSIRATSATQRSDECEFNQVVEYGTPYVCTIVADVTGNGSDDPNTDYDDTFLKNTAYVNAKRDVTDLDEPVTKSNEDTAQVNFDNVLPKLESNFGFHATVFVKMKNTGVESIKLNKMFVRGIAIPDGSGDIDVYVVPNDPTSDIRFKMFDDSYTSFASVLTTAFGETLGGYCQLGRSIAPDEIYSCFIRVQLFNAFGDLKSFDADDGSQGGVTVQVIDDDNTITEGKVNVKVETLNVNVAP